MKHEITLEELEKTLFNNEPVEEQGEFLEDADFIFSDKPEEQITEPLEDATPKAEPNNDIPKTTEKEENNTTTKSQVVKSLLDLGVIPDLEVDIEGETFKLSEVEDIDPDTLKQILETYNQENEDVRKERYLDTNELTPEQINLFKILKNEDISKINELFEKPEDAFEPYKGYDKDNLEHNRLVLFNYYTKEKGLSDKTAKLIISDKEADRNADKTAAEEAEEIVNQVQQAYRDKLSDKAKKAEEEKNKEFENIKNFTKNLEAKYDEIKLPKDVTKKIVSLATKKGTNGDFLIDEVYQDMMKDPEQAQELLLFLADKELFKERIRSEAKKDTNITTARKIKIIASSSKGASKEDTKKATKDNYNPFE